jgi:hypothetical protein
MTVFSDHGMTPVRQCYDLVAEVEALGLRMPGDYLAVYDSTMARFWPFTERARQALRETLTAAPGGRLLGDDELRALGIYFPDRRYGDLVFLLEPGGIIGGSDFSGPGWRPAGMHGYHPDDPYSDAVFLSSQEPPATLSSITDVHALLLQAARAVNAREAAA